MRFILLYILFLTLVRANDIEYSFYIDNKTPYKNEAIILDVNISQVDHSKVMLFKFNLKRTKAYEFYQIDFKENEKHHDLKHQYRYLIYPKQEGRLALEFEMIKSLTDDDKVAYAISGDRDNVKGLVKKDIAVKIEPLTLEVKTLPKNTDLVGDYRLTYRLDKTLTDAYEPVHLNILLKGKGNLPTWSLLPKDKAYHLFTQEPKIRRLHHTKGTSVSSEWDYAISAKESFVLPKVLLKAFDPKTKRSYELLIPEHAIEVKQVAVENLLDEVDMPLASKGFDWSWLGWLFSYVMVFLAGFLMPKDIFKRRKLVEKVSFEDEIASTKTHKELLKLLLGGNDVHYKEAILSLESVVYNGKKISLDKIKKMLDKS